MRILETLSWAEIARALEAIPVGSPLAAPSGASIDTRTLEPRDVFFALKGENFDAHNFIEAAAQKGAAAVIVQNEVPRALRIARAMCGARISLGIASGRGVRVAEYPKTL